MTSTSLITASQSGLSSFGPQSNGFTFSKTDSHATINSVLENVFPCLFWHLLDTDLEKGSLLSSWLICACQCYSNSYLDVLSANLSSPTGANIINAMGMPKHKVPVSERSLFLGVLHYFLVLQFFDHMH